MSAHPHQAATITRLTTGFGFGRGSRRGAATPPTRMRRTNPPAAARVMPRAEPICDNDRPAARMALMDSISACVWSAMRDA
jgi:hypothetical protein